MSDELNIDKELCFREFCNLKSHHRNLISHFLVGACGIVGTGLTIAKISSPWVLFASSIIYTCAHFIKQDPKLSIYKEQLRISEYELQEKESHIRRLSAINESLSSNKSGGSEQNDSGEMDGKQ